MLKGATRREFDMIAAWSVDRLGRSLQHLVAFLGEVSMIADRTEGRVGMRPPEIDPEEASRRVEIQQAIEQIVRALNEPRSQAGDG